MKRFLSLFMLLLFFSSSASLAGAETEQVNLTSLAAVSSSPAGSPESVGMATDGNEASAFVFVAGSKGEGALTLTFSTPHTIDRIRILQGQKSYYSTNYRITADVDGDHTFETILGDKSNAKWGQWDEFNFTPRKVEAVRFESLAGISLGGRAHPVIHEIEVYGEASEDELARLMETSTHPTSVGKLKQLYLETPLVKDGKAVCAILTPEGEQYKKLGEQIAADIKSTFGVAPDVTNLMTNVDPTQETVIALGQMNNNKLIERLYWNHYLYDDSLYPGKDGCVIQTIHNPYPWAAGHNIVVLGGSTFNGVARVVEQFAKILPSAHNGVLPYLLKVTLPAERETGYVVEGKNYTKVKLPAHDLTPAEIATLQDTPASPSLLVFQEMAQRYLVTGEQPYLQAAKRSLNAVCDEYDKNPQRVLPWPEETNSRFIFAAWDAVEEAPVFTDAERLRYTNMLLKFLYSLVPHVIGYANLEKNNTIVFNHTTFPLMGLYWGGRYFRRYYNMTAMDTFLEKAAGAFRGQEKSWKSKEDADSYLTLTMSHTMEYALAENKLAFFTNGNIRTYANYLIAICDNNGWAAGFGDSQIFKSTNIPDAGLPYAFWWTKDPQYLGYLNLIHGGHWLNPYDQNVVPQIPIDHTGLHVFPLDQQVYDYAKSFPHDPYNPQLDILQNEAFDKIAFRQNFDPLGQYFLLDGYARGIHGHYDGNAITKLSDKGEDWLIDGDYLARNTTAHNMVSVIRNGRSKNLEPPGASLLHNADLPSHAFTETMMKNYNGVDWSRNIFWQKGGAIVLLDRLVARSAGEYKFDNVFKCVDEGREKLIAPNRFRIQRGGLARIGNYDLDETKSANAIGKDIVLGKADSQLQFAINLKAAKYRVTLWAKGNGPGTDSLWLSVDGQDPIAFYLPVDKMGPSSASPDKEPPAPTIEIRHSGAHIFSITSRALPGQTINHILIEDIANPQNRYEFDAAKAPEVKTIKDAPAVASQSKQFYIVNADGANQSITDSMGTSGPVKYLFQRRAANLQPTQQTTFANLLYVNDRGEHKNYTLQTLSDSSSTGSAMLAQLEQTTLLVTGDYANKDIQVTAAMFDIAPDDINLVDATNLTITGKQIFSSATPVSLEIDFKRQTATAITSQTVSISLFNTNITLKPGSQQISIKPNAALQQTLQVALKDIATSNQSKPLPKAITKVPDKSVSALKVLWNTATGNTSPLPEVRDFTSADLDGDGHPKLLICRGNELQCYSLDQKLLWKFSSSQLIGAVTVADVDGDGQSEILCGGDDQQFHILNRHGKEIASHKMTEPRIVGQGGTVLPFVNKIVVDDLDGDGKNEIIVGCSNSQINAFSSNLKRIWNLGAIYHGVRDVMTADLNNDGKKEVLAADHYGGISIISADGHLMTRFNSELGDVTMAAGDINRDGKQEMINASSTGTVICATYDQPMKVLFHFDNHGYAARQVLLNSDGKPEIIVASDTGYLYALDSAGKTKWQIDLGSPVLCAALMQESGGDKIVTGQRDGSIKVLNLKGQILSTFLAEAPIKLLKIIPLSDSSPVIATVDEQNHMIMLQTGHA